MEATLGDDSALAVRAAQRKAGRQSSRIVVDVAVPEGRSVELFAEGPAADWALPVPTPIEARPRASSASFLEIDGSRRAQAPTAPR